MMTAARAGGLREGYAPCAHSFDFLIQKLTSVISLPN